MYDDETYSSDYLMHYGRKGMKWYKHIFGKSAGIVSAAVKVSDKGMKKGVRWAQKTGAKAKRKSIDTYEALGDGNSILKSEKGISGIVVRSKARLAADAGNYTFRDDKRAAAKKANADGDVYVTTTNSSTGIQKIQKLNSRYTDEDLKRDMRKYGVEKVSSISKGMDKGKTYAEAVISEHNKEVAYTYAVDVAKAVSTVAVAAAAFGLTQLYTKRMNAGEAPDSDADIDS